MADELAAAAAALARGDWGGARGVYERLLAADPANAEAAYRLGCLLRDQGNLDAAEPLFSQALAVAPDRADVQADLGLVAWRRGDDVGARPRLAAALAAFPQNLRLAGYLASADPGNAVDVLARTLRTRTDWPVELLLAVGRELLVEPTTYRAWFLALAAATPHREAFTRRAEGPATAALPSPWAEVLAMPEPRRVSACMIVRDEAPNLPTLLASLAGTYDELVVLDTGSTDGTVAIAEAAGAKVGHFTWIQDFAAARNACIELATGDWILMVDGDHRLDLRSRRAVKRFLQRPPIDQGTLCFYQARIAEHFDAADPREDNSYLHLAVFPRDPDVRYVGALHEQVTDLHVPPRAIRVAPIPDLVLHHTGYTAEAVERHGKQARNMAILEQQLAESPTDAFVRYNLGMQLRAGGDFAAALPQLREAVRLALMEGGPLRGYVREAMILAADAQFRLGDLGGLLVTADAGLSVFPEDADLLAFLGLARLGTRDPRGAIAPLERAQLQAGRIATGVSNQELSGWVGRAALALATHLAGDEAASRAHAEVLWTTAPDPHQAIKRLVSLSELATGNPEAVAPVLARIGVHVNVTRSPS